MKRKYFFFASCLISAAFWSCNDTGTTSASNTDSNQVAGAPAGTDSMNAANSGDKANMNNMNTTPLSKADSMFVMKAAMGGMAEVEMGNLAQQKGMSARVKEFGAMMVRDHSKANDELKSFAASRSLTIPSALSPDMQKHMEAMQKMSGKSFDKQYVNMMVNDHKNDINEFKKASDNCNDNELKAWAGKTLPTLQMHMDSIQSIRKMKM